MGRKITLEQAKSQGESYLIVYCCAAPAQASGCHHAGTMDLAAAIARVGAGTRLDDIPFRCSQCGSRKTDVRADHPKGPGGKPL